MDCRSTAASPWSLLWAAGESVSRQGAPSTPPCSLLLGSAGLWLSHVPIPLSTVVALLVKWAQHKTKSKDLYVKNTQEHSLGVFVCGNKAEEKCRRGHCVKSLVVHTCSVGGPQHLISCSSSMQGRLQSDSSCQAQFRQQTTARKQTPCTVVSSAPSSVPLGGSLWCFK